MVKDIFAQLIKETVKPLLTSNGYTKKGLDLYKKNGAIIYLFNVQKSHGNSVDQLKFYINCGIHSTEIDSTIGTQELLFPKEHECHFRNRISSLTGSEKDGYHLTKDTDLDVMKENLTNDIEQALSMFQDISSTDDLTDLMIRENGLNNYEELFEYLLLTNDQVRLKRFVKQLHDQFGTEKRWHIFENAMSDILEKHRSEITMNDLLAQA
ncbi:DUF4304 domain-containing protein [Mucilaginibacter daejeonensis]|uniref:DUF4304 domain-containing protein n=1 Tax=Mucilaginibacter daejeonensis TaxID=398049 RepID=UPI001D170A91|nr:DUF4304 domain-containing protein [Mucilaginibacter daejeonensis]UEG54145.1 DUF4304 domain-containing protein [Mucilaginibacter daejeonensis]